MAENKQKSVGSWLSEFGAWGLGGAMFVFLGFRTLHFLEWTFADQDKLFAYLGLFSTTLGAVIWGLIYRFGGMGSRNKAISLLMLGVDLIGEMALAVADMTLVTSQNGVGWSLTQGEVNTFIWAAAGLAAANGIAIFVVKLFPEENHPNG